MYAELSHIRRPNADRIIQLCGVTPYEADLILNSNTDIWQLSVKRAFARLLYEFFQNTGHHCYFATAEPRAAETCHGMIAPGTTANLFMPDNLRIDVIASSFEIPRRGIRGNCRRCRNVPFGYRSRDTTDIGVLIALSIV